MSVNGYALEHSGVLLSFVVPKPIAEVPPVLLELWNSNKNYIKFLEKFTMLLFYITGATVGIGIAGFWAFWRSRQLRRSEQHRERLMRVVGGHDE